MRLLCVSITLLLLAFPTQLLAKKETTKIKISGVNGRDVERTTQQSYGLACRLYAGGRGVPPLEVLQHAVAGAHPEKAES